MEAILKLLGAKSESEALEILARFNASITELKTLYASASPADAFASARGAASLLAEVRQATGKTTIPEMIAVVAGWRISADKVNDLEGKIKAQIKAQEDADAKALIDGTCKDGRLEPKDRAKAESMYAQFGIDGLKAFIDVLPAPTMLPGSKGPQQKAPESGGATPTEDTMAITAAERSVAKILGLLPQEFEENKKHYEELQGVGDKGNPNAMVFTYGYVEKLNRRVVYEGFIPCTHTSIAKVKRQAASATA